MQCILYQIYFWKVFHMYYKLICILYALLCGQNFILVKNGCYKVNPDRRQNPRGCGDLAALENRWLWNHLPLTSTVTQNSGVCGIRVSCCSKVNPGRWCNTRGGRDLVALGKWWRRKTGVVEP
jgi:hypothetical protein